MKDAPLPVRRIVVLGNGRKPEVAQAVDELLPWLGERAEVVLVDLEITSRELEVDADLALVFGGDGTILAAAHRLGEKQIPVLGVNFGKFGFLAEFSVGELKDRLDDLLAGDLHCARRIMLRCSVRPDVQDGAGTDRRFVGPGNVALNEVAIMAPPSRMATLALYVDGEPATTYRGDGLIVATPVGSTAHSLSAGGPVMHPDLDALVLTPICPHSLTNRPVVLSASAKVRVVNDSDDLDLTVAVDGRVLCTAQPGVAVCVEKFPHPFLLIETARRTFFRTLRDKLNWGGHPNYDVRQTD